MEYVTLSNGVKMPILGYGVYQVTPEECERCVLDALKAGYRSIDTAQVYFNEEQVGSAIQKSGVPREEIFLTTKVWLEHYGYEQTLASVKESMRKLQTDYLDLLLLHQPFGEGRGGTFENPVIADIAAKHGKTPAQVMLRWHIQRGIVVIPKSTHYERMVENFNVFDFALTDEDMTAIAALDTATSSFFSHQDPATIEWLAQMVEQR
jgi:diketogulonate reductase-like aldo/keto reductase